MDCGEKARLALAQKTNDSACYALTDGAFGQLWAKNTSECIFCAKARAATFNSIDRHRKHLKRGRI
jgi:hypothetical protein